LNDGLIGNKLAG